MVAYYEGQFKKLEEWEKHQPQVRKEIRSKVSKGIINSKSSKLGLRKQIEREEIPSVESMNRLSTLNEQEEIDYEAMGDS